MRELVKEYNWYESNPSQTKALPIILSSALGSDDEPGWMAARSYENEEMFTSVEALYRISYPILFEQLAAWAVIRANTPMVLDDIEESMKHYYRGAVITINALERSTPDGFITDVSKYYADTLTELDMIDLESWLRFMWESTIEQRNAVASFIENDYQWLNEPIHLNSAMHIGSQHAYILITHNRGCLEREQEIAWITRDDESREAWLRYCQDQDQ